MHVVLTSHDVSCVNNLCMNDHVSISNLMTILVCDVYTLAFIFSFNSGNLI